MAGFFENEVFAFGTKSSACIRAHYSKAWQPGNLVVILTTLASQIRLGHFPVMCSLIHLFLIFCVTLGSPLQLACFAGEFSKQQQPADAPKNLSEESEEEEAKGSELTDDDEIPSYAIALGGVEFDFQTWVQHHLETTFCCNTCHYSYGHCRAPPVTSC